MKYKPQKVYTDERTLQLERKLGNEVAFFAIILLLISIFIKIRLVVFGHSEVVWSTELS